MLFKIFSVRAEGIHPLVLDVLTPTCVGAAPIKPFDPLSTILNLTNSFQCPLFENALNLFERKISDIS